MRTPQRTGRNRHACYAKPAVSAPARWECPHAALIPLAALCADDIWTWRQPVLGESRSRCSCMLLSCLPASPYTGLRYALTFLLGMSGRRHLRRPLCLCAWTQQGVSFHPLWSLCLMFLLRACVPQVYIPLTPCVKKTLGCCNRLEDDARAAGEFQINVY